LIIGDQLDNRNRLDSELLRADMTPTEKAFALRVEHLLNDIQHPEYRQLCIETLLALSEILRANPRLELEDDLVLDVIIGNAAYLTWRETHPTLDRSGYNEHCEAWSDFYAKPPHQVANGIMDSLLFLLRGGGRGD
jgi:phosphorylase kinase alpha/beta subunit